MGMEPMTYGDVRTRMQPGDVVGFGGANVLSEIIMKAGNSRVSHTGIIVERATGDGAPRFLEATVRLKNNDRTLVAKITSFLDRLEEYDGDVWWLPLSAAVRGNFREQDFVAFCHGIEGKLFDIAEGVLVVLKDALRIRDRPVPVRTGDFLFCSELVVDALEHGRVIGHTDPAGVTPADLSRWSIYADTYGLLKGDLNATIDGYNTLPPGTH